MEGEKKASFFEATTGIVGFLGMAAIAAAFVDAQYVDFLPGENPFSGSDESEGGLFAFKSILRDLRDIPGEDVLPENYSPKQDISVTGASLTFFGGVVTGRPLKSLSVGGAGTLGTLAAYEASLLPLGALSGLAFYGGASVVMYTAAIVSLLKKPSNPLQQVKDGVEKVKKVVKKVRG